MLRKNGLVRLQNGKFGKIVAVERFKNSWRTGGASFSESGITSVTVRTLDNKFSMFSTKDELLALTPVTKDNVPHDEYPLLKALSNDISEQVVEALERVWKRQDEAKKIFIDNQTFAEVERLDVKVLKKIAEDEGVTFEQFITYAQNKDAQLNSAKKRG